MKAPKALQDKIEKVSKAWEDLAPEKKYGGMSLAEFKARVKPSLDARDSVNTVDVQRVDAISRRETSDQDSTKALQLVINSIKGDPTEGEDSALYQASGYVPKSKRKSGLSRKTKAAAPPATPA